MIWDERSDISTVSPRVLQRDDSCAMLQELDNESVSSQSGEEVVTQEEEEQEAERLDEVAVNDEIALLRPHGTNWAVTEGISVDCFTFSFVWNFTSPVAQRTVLVVTVQFVQLKEKETMHTITV